MTVVATPAKMIAKAGRVRWSLLLTVLAAGLILLQVTGIGGDLAKPPRWLQLPLDAWVRSLFEGFLGISAAGFSMVDLFRGIAWLVKQPLDLLDGLLVTGFPALGAGPLHWLVIVLLAGGIGAATGLFRLCLLGLLGMLYLVVFSLWPLSMQTLALVLVTTPLAALPGIALAVLIEQRPRLEKALTPLFDILQSMPQIAYLVPAVVLFGLGEATAVLATVVFATPAMARCVLVGLREIPAEVSEAGIMAGTTPWQQVFLIRLPAARKAVLMGFNQVIMIALAMIVIASLIGARGLGHEVLIQLDRLRLGRALEVGLGIAVLAVVLDRLGNGMVRRAELPGRIAPAMRWLASALFGAAGLVVLAQIGGLLPDMEPAKGIVSTAGFWDGLIADIVSNWSATLQDLRSGFLIWFALPIRQFLLWLPWPLVILLASLAGLTLGGWRLMALALGVMLFPAVTGLWVPAMTTVYMITTAILICVMIGIPLSIIVSRSDRASRIVLLGCDVLQTLPSFIYLVPFVMLFRVGDVSAIAAIATYALIPLIRYSVFGLCNIPAEANEAAVSVGCAPLQRLLKVELPLALPQILLGLNQMILFGLFTLSVTALVGARDLSQTIYRALAAIDPGKGLVAGICIALFAILADRMIHAAIARNRA